MEGVAWPVATKAGTGTEYFAMADVFVLGGVRREISGPVPVFFRVDEEGSCVQTLGYLPDSVWWMKAETSSWNCFRTVSLT